MNESGVFLLSANAVLVCHLALVLFLVGGLPLVVAGNLLRWRWVNALWFRWSHLSVIVFVAAEAWLGIVCPLTILEQWLRSKSKTESYQGSFVEHWLQALLFWQAPAWVFTLLYTGFALAVAVTWWRFPPTRGQGCNAK